MSLKSQEIAGIVFGVLASFTGLLLVLLKHRKRRHHLQQQQLVDVEKLSEKRFSTSSSSLSLSKPSTSASPFFIPSISISISNTESCSPVGSPKEPQYTTYSSLNRSHSVSSLDSMSMYSIASAPREAHDWLFAARESKIRVSSLIDYDVKSVRSMATSTTLDVYPQDPASVDKQQNNVPIHPLPDASAPLVPAIPHHLKNIRPLPRPPPVVRKSVPYNNSLARPAAPPRSHFRSPMEGIRE